MKIAESRAVAMIAVLRDGSPDAGEAVRCDGLLGCGRFKTEFALSRGLRERLPHRNLPERVVACTNADKPCLHAVKAKPILEALREASRP